MHLRRSLADAAASLESQAAEINALNVFPVPDGDTGTNMSLTLLAAVREAESASDNSVGAVARAAAHGALLGARGNSGVILSQFLRGIARCLDKHVDCGGAEFAEALALGSATAYKAVIRPVEGTMLTVGRDAAQAAMAAAKAGADLTDVLGAAVDAARTSVARTPSLLPILRQAGVVDAGGQGLLCLLEGLLRASRGESPAVGAVVGEQGVPVQMPALAQHGYCTEFLIRGEALDLDAIRARVVSLGDSALVVGDGDVARVHVHTFRPGLVLEYATSIGTLHQVKIDNMQDQHQHVLEEQRERERAAASQPIDRTQPSPLPTGENQRSSNHDQPAVVAVAAGAGFCDIFRSLGVSAIVPGGQTMNPSIEEILRAVQEIPARQILLLPNNRNIILAAQQVRLLTDKELAVVPTRDVAEGVAAALAFQPESGLAANARAMERAFRSVRSAEITTAVRAAKVDGLEIRAGEVVGLAGGQLAAVGTDLDEIVYRTLENMGAEHGQILTLYYGAEVDAPRAERLAAQLKARYPNLEVEVVHGGQPLYQYVMALE